MCQGPYHAPRRHQLESEIAYEKVLGALLAHLEDEPDRKRLVLDLEARGNDRLHDLLDATCGSAGGGRAVVGDLGRVVCLGRPGFHQ
jgi:hypothetical protein